jgi:hypothetical protein
MAKIPDVVRFQELSTKDRILCTYSDGSRNLDSSVKVMDLVDEITVLERKFITLTHRKKPRPLLMERSLMLVMILQGVRDAIEEDYESELLKRGKL